MIFMICFTLLTTRIFNFCIYLGLPAFFQSKTKTVLDELADFELGGGLEDDGMDEMEPSSTDMDAFEDMTGTFGDLNADNLPDFFKNPTKAEQENYDIFDSMANQTLDDEPNMGM